MKLVTFIARDGRRRSGMLSDGDRGIVDLQARHQARKGRAAVELASVLAIVEAGSPALDLIRSITDTPQADDQGSIVPADGVRLDAPIPEPPQIRDFLGSEKHMVDASRRMRENRARQSDDREAAMRDMERNGIFAVPAIWYERPLFIKPNRFNVIGHDVDVHWPAYSKVWDFELELAAYVGTAGRDIARSQAREHIFGYTIFNDFTARDEQALDLVGQCGPGKGKDFDGSKAMGPCLVTADELPDPYRLTMIARVNGEERGRGSCVEMRWRFEDCIAHISRSETLRPGEVFGSGTISGVVGLETGLFLGSGDVVELEIEGIGILRNRVL